MGGRVSMEARAGVHALSAGRYGPAHTVRPSAPATEWLQSARNNPKRMYIESMPTAS